MTASPELHTLQISARPPQPWTQTIYAFLFMVVFDFACLMINGSQFIFLLPLRVLPFQWASKLYEEGIRYTKGAFACLLILMNQWFAPTTFMITFERDGKGRFSEEDIERIVVRDQTGKVVSLNLPTKSVLIANHQVYADWWYAWCLTYFMGTHKDVCIVLKKSLKWVPIVGWGMQFYNFIFLARSWASDRVHLASHLSFLGREAEREDKPLTLIIYPEGTLVSNLTRPVSKKFADKTGIPDMVNTLHPRSTGLHYSLRSLAPRIPALQLIDITVVYPGIPLMEYGQSYYTLRSIFFDGVPPPAIHMHLRMFTVASEVPIGDISASNPAVLPNDSPSKRTVEVDIPDEEKSSFELWLRELWQDKDRSITRFFETGSFSSGQTEQTVIQIPLKLRYRREFLDAFCFFLPAAAGYLWGRIRYYM